MINKTNSKSSLVYLNPMGGLGNQIFCLISYSIKYNKKFLIYKFLPNLKNKNLDKRNTYWDNIFKSISYTVNSNKINIKQKFQEEKQFQYRDIPRFNSDVLLTCYFQNPSYFKNNYEEIIEILNINEIQNNFKSIKILLPNSAHK